jgi:hypothetical protein
LNCDLTLEVENFIPDHIPHMSRRGLRAQSPPIFRVK